MNTSVTLKANDCVDATALPLTGRALPPDHTLEGQPRVGTLELGQLAGRSIGVWEISPSISTDVEADEFLVVLSGRATVSFDDGSPDLHLQPGTVARLKAGSRTVWTVTETLRKIYIV
jgi:uncharacterized cupin superfamily protein